MRFIYIFAILICMILAACNTPPKVELDSNTMDSTRVISVSGVTVSFTPQWLHQAQFAGFYVAQKKGFYANLGLNVIINQGNSELSSASQLYNKSTDFTSMFLLTAMREHSSGNRVVNLAQLSQESSLLLVGKKSKGINSLASFNNKKIGLWRSDFYELSKIILAKNNIAAEVIPMDDGIDLFVSGAIDVMNVMKYNELHLLYQAGYDFDELWTYEFRNSEMSLPEDGIYTSEDFFLNNPEVCKDFADASLQGWIYAINNPEEAIDIVVEVMREAKLPVNRPHQAWMLDKIRESMLLKPQIGKLYEEDFNRANQILIESNMIRSKIDFKEFHPNAKK